MSDAAIEKRFRYAVDTARARRVIVTTADRELVGVRHDGERWRVFRTARVSPVGAFLLDEQPTPMYSRRLQLVGLYPTLSKALDVCSAWLDGLFTGLGAPSAGEGRAHAYRRGLCVGRALFDEVVRLSRGRVDFGCGGGKMVRADLVSRTEDVMFELAVAVDRSSRGDLQVKGLEEVACLLAAFSILRNGLSRCAPDGAQELALSVERELVNRLGDRRLFAW